MRAPRSGEGKGPSSSKHEHLGIGSPPAAAGSPAPPCPGGTSAASPAGTAKGASPQGAAVTPDEPASCSSGRPLPSIPAGMGLGPFGASCRPEGGAGYEGFQSTTTMMLRCMVRCGHPTGGIARAFPGKGPSRACGRRGWWIATNWWRAAAAGCKEGVSPAPLPHSRAFEGSATPRRSLHPPRQNRCWSGWAGPQPNSLNICPLRPRWPTPGC
jgi:hypothetical protein